MEFVAFIVVAVVAFGLGVAFADKVKATVKKKLKEAADGDN